MAALTPQVLSRAGIAPTYGAVTASDTFPQAVGVAQFLHVKNGNAAACTVTLVDGGRTPAGSLAANPTVVVPATTGDRMIGPIPNSMADQTTNLLTALFSVTPSVTVALVQVPTG